MQLNSKQQTLTVEVSEKQSGSVRPISALMSVVLGGILSVAAFSAAKTQDFSDNPIITVGSLASVTERPLDRKSVV